MKKHLLAISLATLTLATASAEAPAKPDSKPTASECCKGECGKSNKCDTDKSNCADDGPCKTPAQKKCCD